MAITLEANYSKKIGLPQYSSHQFSVTLRTEVADLNQVQQESARLHALLQKSVDDSLQEVGWLPETNGNGHTNDTWQCSDKQKELILKLVEDHKLDKATAEQLAQRMFSKGVKQLNKLEASGLIEELLDQHSRNGNGHNRLKKGAAK